MKNSKNKVKSFLILFLILFGLFYKNGNIYPAREAVEDLLARRFSFQERIKIKKMIKIILDFRTNFLNIFEYALKNDKLKIWQVFDRFYIPIKISEIKKKLGNRWSEEYRSFPPQFHTEYDRYLDKFLYPLIKKYVKKYSLIYIVAADVNGYVPTHIANKPLTGNLLIDIKKHRHKRIFNDLIGLRAARNTSKNILLQDYVRDTGERFIDLSTPVFIRGRHWGAIRMGFKL